MEQRYAPLVNAAADGNLANVKIWLNIPGVEANVFVTAQGHTPLLIASQKGHTKLVSLLLEHRAAVELVMVVLTYPKDTRYSEKLTWHLQMAASLFEYAKRFRANANEEKNIITWISVKVVGFSDVTVVQIFVVPSSLAFEVNRFPCQVFSSSSEFHSSE